MATQFTKGKIYKLNPADLLSDPQQPRKFMDPNSLDELAASIRKHGVLEPILFRKIVNNINYLRVITIVITS